MEAPRAWLLCLLLLGLVLPASAHRAHQHSMGIRTPDVNPAWYAGRGIRPVGRFGRRRAAPWDVPKLGLRCRLTSLPSESRAESPWDR